MVGVVRAVFSVAWFNKLCEALPVAEQEERKPLHKWRGEFIHVSLRFLRFHAVNFSFLGETTEPESSSRNQVGAP